MSKLISSNKYSDIVKKMQPLGIYKLNYLVNGSIDGIIIFYGKIKKDTEEIEELFKSIFTDDEIEYINSKKITPIFVEEEIHYDDSISTIKIKILNVLKERLSIMVSFDEIYLFCQKLESLNAVSVYQSLTQNKKLELTKIRLQQFLSNIVSDENGNEIVPLADKDVYTFDDILEMKLDNKTYIINKVLGQKFFIVENEYPFVSNPYNITDYDKFFEKNARKSLSTLNGHLLLNSGSIMNNNIYLCLANNVLDFVSKKQISEETTIKIYYPFLYSKNIHSLEDLRDEKEKLLENNKKIINDKTNDLFKSVSMFYDVYKLKKTDLKYVSKGIKYIKAIIKPDFDINIPLEIIFKIIHATENNPLIKYNPSSRQENIYRLYTDKISIDGRKIPYLKKAVIFKLMKTIAKTKSVSVFIEIKNEEIIQTLICEFDENGYITISSEFETILSEVDVNNLIRESINPIISEIKNLLEQSGYKLKLFNSLYDSNVEIKQINYVSQIKINKPIDLSIYKNCISSIFNNESSELKTGIHLRFKRVSNFSKVSSQEAFILEKSEQGYRGVEIVEALLENFPNDLNRNQAEELIRKIANEIQVERGVRKSDIKIKNNPGFKTTILFEQKISVITISVENINDIHYLQTIPVYLDTMIRLTQDKNSTNYPVQEINTLCSTGEKEEILAEDIISSTEKSAEEVEVPFLEDEEENIDYQKYKSIKTDKPKVAFSLFFDEDEEYEEIEGGKNTSSEESIDSDKSSFDIEPMKEISSEESIDSDKSSSAVESPKSLESFGVNSSSSVEESIDSDKSLSAVESPKEIIVASSEPIQEIPKEETLKSLPPKIDLQLDIPVNIEKEEKIAPLPVEDFKRIDIMSDSENTTDTMPELEHVLPEENAEEKAEEKEYNKEVEEEDIEEQENEVRNIDGMKLNKPYYFQSLIESKDPVLILKEDSAEYNAYSRTCSSDTRRQPVILTDEQLAKINKEHKGFLRDEDVIKYGSNPNNKFNYICPRYWCLKTNTIVDPRELKEVVGKDGKKELEHPTCGKVIPRKDKEVKPGYYIYEFYESEHKNVDKYDKAYKKHDNDKDGLIDFNEFKKILKDLKEDYTEKSWSEHYTKINGIKPSADQVREFLEKQESNMRKMFDYEDTNKDDKINYKEFINVTAPRKYPGLIPDKHPKGLCLPCCFDKYNTEGRILANTKCFEENKKEAKEIKHDKGNKKKLEEPIETKMLSEPKEKEKEKELHVKQIQPEEKVAEQDEYIKGPDKFPLTKGRWGYLPFGIQKMLHEVNADCQISKTNTNIKPDHPCLLRHGIEINKNQSFIACISNILFFNKVYIDQNNIKKFKKVLNIKDMKERIIKSITIDSFVTYQNGNLVTDFHDMNNTNSIDVSKYKEKTNIFSKLNIGNDNELYYMKKVISAFENFKNFLRDDDAIIDHTYLWDIISMPNKDLFELGANLIIFKIPNDDITNNVQLLCPTNHYSKEFYNSKKPTIIMLKQDDYYEPIYSYTIREKLEIITQFKEIGSKISPELRRVINEIIKPYLDIMCKPLDSMPNVYKAKKPLMLYELLLELKSIQYKIDKFVMNFNNKVIGVIAEEPKTQKECFVPCYPSSIQDNEDFDIVFMNDLSLWNNYYNTVRFLNNLEKRTKNRKISIPCKPAFKIVEDEWVVGILTETNQFIQISQPISELEADDDFILPSIKDQHYIVNKNINKDTKSLLQIDIPVSSSNDVDEERVEYIKKTKMETGFYNVFRNTIRILLNDYENVKLREEIEQMLKKEYIIYSEKLDNVYNLLKKLVNNTIQFTGDDNYYKLINQISTCVVKNKDTCDSTPNLCTFTKDGKCNLILPENNLITKKENKLIYFKRIADELIRYSRINSFMLQPQTYLSFGNIGYNLNENEIIMIQSLLTQEYFETLVPAAINKYTKYNSYDEAEPIMTQMYENNVSSLDKVIEIENQSVCEPPKINQNITSGIWKKCFPDDYKDIEYNNTTICTFQFIIDLIEKYTGIKHTINKIKNELYNEYKQYLEKYQDKIVDILIIEGKKTFGKIIKGKKNTIDFSTFISEENYFLTTLDLWMLVEKYKIPTIFISQSCILQTNYEKHAFLGYGDESDDFVFILLPGFNGNKPNYKLIQNNHGEVFISSRHLTCQEYIDEIIGNKITIESYLHNFTKQTTTNYQSKTKCKESDLIHQVEKPKKSKKLIVEEDIEPIVRPVVENPKKQTKKLIVEEDIEPVVQPVVEKTEKPKKQTKKQKTTPEKQGTRKRCPNGMVRNKQGECVDKNMV